MKFIKRLFRKRIKPMTYEEARDLKLHFLLTVDNLALTYLDAGQRAFCNLTKEKCILIKRTLEYHLETVNLFIDNEDY
jgi:hypothetical protein